MNQISDPQLKQITDTQLLQLIAWRLGAGGSGGGSSSATILVQTVGFLLAPPGTTNQALTYVGSTNNVHTIVYSGGSVTRTVTFTYKSAGAADNDLVTNITQADS